MATILTFVNGAQKPVQVELRLAPTVADRLQQQWMDGQRGE